MSKMLLIFFLNTNLKNKNKETKIPNTIVDCKLKLNTSKFWYPITLANKTMPVDKIRPTTTGFTPFRKN